MTNKIPTYHYSYTNKKGQIINGRLLLKDGELIKEEEAPLDNEIKCTDKGRDIGLLEMLYGKDYKIVKTCLILMWVVVMLGLLSPIITCIVR